MKPLRIFLLATLILVVFVGFSENSNAETEPIAHWSFDEGEGNIAHDESGNGNDGTLENNPVWVDGVSGSALHFDGIDEHVQFPDLISGELADFTVSVWLNVLFLGMCYKYTGTINIWIFIVNHKLLMLRFLK